MLVCFVLMAALPGATTFLHRAALIPSTPLSLRTGMDGGWHRLRCALPSVSMVSRAEEKFLKRNQNTTRSSRKGESIQVPLPKKEEGKMVPLPKKEESQLVPLPKKEESQLAPLPASQLDEMRAQVCICLWRPRTRRPGH